MAIAADTGSLGEQHGPTTVAVFRGSLVNVLTVKSAAACFENLLGRTGGRHPNASHTRRDRGSRLQTVCGVIIAAHPQTSGPGPTTAYSSP